MFASCVYGIALSSDIYHFFSFVRHDRTFEVYKAELLSSRLTWSPPHLSEQFWIKNWKELKKENYALLRYDLFSVFIATGA